MSAREFEENKNTYIPFKDKMSQYPCVDPEKYAMGGLRTVFFCCHLRIYHRAVPQVGILIFSYTYVGSAMFSNFWILILLGVLRKMNIILSWKFLWIFLLDFDIIGGSPRIEYFFELEDFVDIFWGHFKIGLYLGISSL